MPPSLKDLIAEIGVPFKDDKIEIPEWVTSIKFDVGVCYTATHTQNWLDADKGAMVFGFEPNPLSYKSITSKPEDRPRAFAGTCTAKPVGTIRSNTILSVSAVSFSQLHYQT